MRNKMNILKITYNVIFVVSVALLAACSQQKDSKAPEKSLPEKTVTPISQKVETENFISEANLKKIKSHPRLFLKKEDFVSLKENLKNNKVAKNISDNIIIEADKILKLPPLERKQIGRRLLEVSRESLRRIFYLSYAYQMTEDKKYASAAEREMLCSAAFSDWNPPHFLDVAEMSLGMAIGYDWCFDTLSESAKKEISNAIIEKGLNPSLKKIRSNWWLRSKGNWNQVCNASMFTAALAVYELDPNMAKNVMERSIATNQKAFEVYAPDGVYPEGPTYWSYGTSFQIALIDMLRCAFGDSLDLENKEGFRKSAEFIVACQSPIGLQYNYSDNRSTQFFSTSMIWFANETNNTSLIYPYTSYFKNALNGKGDVHHSILKNRLLPMYMPSISKINFKNIEDKSSNLWVGRGVIPVAMVKCKNIYLGIKGGKARVSHGHMDAGSFVFDKNGERWICDSNYAHYHEHEKRGINLHDNKKPDGQKWKVLGYSPKSHACIIVNDKKFDVNAIAQIVETYNSPNRLGVKIDLSKTLLGEVKSAFRTARVIDSERLEIVDEIEAREDLDAKVLWNFPTYAKIEKVSENEFILTQKGKNVSVKATTNVPINAKLLPLPVELEHEVKINKENFAGFEFIVPKGKSVKFVVTIE